MNIRDASSVNPVGLIVMLVLFTTSFAVAYALSTQNIYWVSAAVIGVGFFTIGFLSPRISLYILIFSMLLSPEIGNRDMSSGEGFSVRLEDLLLLVMGFAWLAKTAIHKDLGLTTYTKINRPIFTYSLICVISTLWGTINGHVNSLVTGMLFVIKYFEYFVIYFITINIVESRQQVKNILTAMFITFIIVLLFGFSQIPQGNRISAPFEGEDLEPNTLGGYIVIMMSISLALFTNLKMGPKKIAVGTLCAFSFIALLYTLSRSSWLAMVPAYMGIIFFSKRRMTLVLALVMGMIIAPFTLPDMVVERFKYTFTGGGDGPIISEQEAAFIFEGRVIGRNQEYDSSTEARLGSMRKALEGLQKHPLLGYGVTGWEFLDAQYHLVLIETGVLGFMAFIYLLWTTAAMLNRVRKRYKSDILYHTLSVGTFCAFLGLLTHAIGTNSFIVIRLMEPFWCLVALNMAIPIIEGDSEKKEFGL